MKQIPLHGRLGEGKFALVDDDDYDVVMQYRWYAAQGNSTLYASSYTTNCSKKDRKTIRMHRLIARPSPDQQIDHINHDGLDNRKSNLRFANQAQQSRNRRSHRNSVSRYRGVRYNKKKEKWFAIIKCDGKPVASRYCDSEEDSARVYDVFALKYHGEFACLNFPDSVDVSIALFEKMETQRGTPTSKYRGVSRSSDGRYITHIYYDGEQHHVGSFKTEIEAARAYDAEVIRLGLNRPLNFPELKGV